jgi:uncharacterized lipoprotein
VKKLLLALSATLFLTGCSSSASIYDQADLIDYENCLEALRQVPYNYSTTADAINALDFQISTCSAYLP